MAKGVCLGGRSYSLIECVATGGVMLVLAGTPLLSTAAQRLVAIARAQAWTVAGAPCPGLSPAEVPASGYRIAHAIDYGDVRFGRAYGYVSCVEVSGDGGWSMDAAPVCQFNSPSLLQVTTRRGDFYFLTRMRPATVSIVDGRPRCVLNASVGLIALE
jgi:hypothetical protein